MKPNNISMEVTEEQFNRDLLNKLKESGHKPKVITCFKSCKYLVSLGEDDNVTLTNLKEPRGYLISSYNPELFLAILNMSNIKEGRPGEYVKCIGSGITDDCFTINKLYKLHRKLTDRKAIEEDDTGKSNGFNLFKENNNFTFFVKPTFEEILAHFGIYSPIFKITPEIMAEKLRKIQELNQ